LIYEALEDLEGSVQIGVGGDDSLNSPIDKKEATEPWITILHTSSYGILCEDTFVA